ncbi:hypothetical protein J1N10_18785 [Carboxylicivirga sp. A043]|uniref:hypothetical protein n=1 Tax=Carboxylicivirga litoralis TaxID=2816963 RepID=UPI0021CB68D8|nr:hypothetical protein [Carboxylicivirga sp. A043]MCU4158028.1 hypothetical protein [Carboxylicivirga sp. A043]
MRKHKYLSHINVGRDGNVIFYLIGEQMRLRSYNQPKDPKTEKQLRDRNLHGTLNLISAQTKALRQFCYKGVPTYSNSHNAFIGLHKQFMRKASLDTAKVYEHLHWSRGKRSGAKSMTVERSNHHFLLKWRPGNMNAMSDYKSTAIWVLRNVSKEYWKWNLTAGLRPDGQCSISLRDDHYMDECILWLFFYNPKLKQFSEDQIMHIPAGETSCTKAFGGNYDADWSLYESIYEEVIASRQEERINW